MPEMIEATKDVCRRCRYSKKFSESTRSQFCDCLSMTGSRRIRDETGELCGSYEKKQRKQRKKVK